MFHLLIAKKRLNKGNKVLKNKSIGVNNHCKTDIDKVLFLRLREKARTKN